MNTRKQHTVAAILVIVAIIVAISSFRYGEEEKVRPASIVKIEKKERVKPLSKSKTEKQKQKGFEVHGRIGAKLVEETTEKPEN